MTTDLQEKAAEEAEEMELAAEIAEETMLGDLMKWNLSAVQNMQKPYGQMSEKEQKDFLISLENRCRSAVSTVVDIVASRNHVVVNAIVDQVVFKDGIKATLKFPPGTDGRHDLADADGRMVKVFIPDAEIAEGEKPKAEADQRGLDLGHEYNDSSEGDLASQDSEDNDAYQLAVDFVTRERRASISGIQRELKIGYNRAARIVELMEVNGVVSEMSSSGTRTVLTPDPGEQEEEQENEEQESTS